MANSPRQQTRQDKTRQDVGFRDEGNPIAGGVIRSQRWSSDAIVTILWEGLALCTGGTQALLHAQRSASGRAS